MRTKRQESMRKLNSFVCTSTRGNRDWYEAGLQRKGGSWSVRKSPINPISSMKEKLVLVG